MKPMRRIHGAFNYPLFKPIRLEAGAASVFDIRELRDSQVRDVFGATLPKTLAHGQFSWSVVGSDAHFSGRAEIVSRRDRVSSSFSCWMCCPDSILAATVENWGDTSTLNIGEATVLAFVVQKENCFGDRWWTGGWPEWSYNSSVVTDEQYGDEYLFTALSEGWTSVTGTTWFDLWYQPNEDTSCVEAGSYGSGSLSGGLLSQCFTPQSFHQVGVSTPNGRLQITYNWMRERG